MSDTEQREIVETLFARNQNREEIKDAIIVPFRFLRRANWSISRRNIRKVAASLTASSRGSLPSVCWSRHVSLPRAI